MNNNNTNTVIAWVKIGGLIAVTCVYLADVAFPRDVAIWNLACLCIVFF